MKPKTIKTLVLLAAMAPASIFAQTTAKTVPVGYISHSLAGNTTSNPFGADTYIYPTLIEGAAFAGVTTNDPSGTNALSFASGVPTGLVGTHVIEISTGSSEGWWSEVTATTATSITTADNLPTGLGVGAKITLRKLPTLRSFFANLPTGLSIVDGVNADAPDELQRFNPLTQTASAAVYATTAAGVAADGWYDIVTLTDVSDQPIYPGEGLKFKRYRTSGITLVSEGEVKITKTQVDIQPQYNWIGQTLAVGGTLGGMDFYNAFNKEDGDSGTAPEADVLETLSAAQSANIYSAVDPSLGLGNILVDMVSLNDASNILLNEGTGFIIKRDATAPASTMTVPAQAVAP